jgi:membrane protein involved in colicin uptake
LEDIRDIEEATTELKQSIIIIEQLQKQMNDLQQKMEKQLNAIIAERKKIFDENEAKREAEENARQAEKEAEEKAKEEAEKEKSKPKAASSDKLTPTQFRKAAASPAKQTPATEPQSTAAKPKHTLEAVENILLNHEVSGTITKSYEEIPEYKLPGIGILEPVEGKMPETSGKIITK